MTKDYRRELQGLFRKLFQFDSADLDFGIYRIMNYKRDEIERFIEEDLIKAVDIEFEKYSAKSKGKIDEELDEIRKRIASTLGEDALLPSGDLKEMYRSSPIAKEFYNKKEDLKNNEMADQHKAEIFSHIYQFFSRYYDDGDFISMRRYSRKNKYAVPYNGEEVLLHWANKDQYYIKTGEYFKNYSFKVGEYKVYFMLKEIETDQNNGKSGKRFFLLKGGKDSITYDNEYKELTIFFEYRALKDEETGKYGTRDVQRVLLDEAGQQISFKIDVDGLRNALQKTDDEKTLLEKHLLRYAKRNTTDYFIHKDLKSFLSGEFDFYIKNEVIIIDELGTEKELNIEEYIGQIKVMKKIGLKIINFLAQIEDFQLKLFKKRKFVIKSEYCLTLDRIPEKLYEEITRNKLQIKEWIDLFKLDGFEHRTLANNDMQFIDIQYLKTHPYLVLDTKFFDNSFKDKLLASFDNFDQEINGLMIKSENWQALNLIKDKYEGKIKCIYIDPPYNTGSDDFIYKDNYRHSSWLSLLENRLNIAQSMLAESGLGAIQVNDIENWRLRGLIERVFGPDSYLVTITSKCSTVSSFRTINLGPVDITDQIILFANNRNKLAYNQQYVIKKEVDLAHFSRFVEDKSCDPKEWKFKPIKLQVLQNMGFNGSNTREGARYAKEKYGEFAESIILRNCEKFAVENADRVFETKTLQKPSPWIRPLIQQSKQSDSIIALNRENRDTIYLYRGRQIYFLSNNIQVINGEKALVEPISNLWDDIDTNNLRHEGDVEFDNGKKPLKLIERIVSMTDQVREDFVIDFFAGSGSTGQAVINLNSKDKLNRKYILIEIEDYFDKIVKTRIEKAIYAKNWRDGTPQDEEGSSHIFKYMYLEQYEDTLNNIEILDSGTVQRTLEELDSYFLRYMLEFETRDSPCRLNVDKLNHPFDYTLKVTHNNEMRDEKVDLVETFNYLLGLHIIRIKAFHNNGGYYRVVNGKKAEDTVTIIWRSTDGLDLKADKEFIEDRILKEFKANKVYVNSDCFVEGVIPIEPEFKRLMGA